MASVFIEKSSLFWVYFFLVNLSQICPVIVIGFVAYLKDTQDILQGISKLDYLVKLSLFQRYKDRA